MAGLAVLLVFLLAWPLGLLWWTNSHLHHVEALSGAEDTPGTTYLIAGSDQRGTGGVNDSTEGARTDSIMLLNVPPSGKTALMSLPRDTLVEVPGYGQNKINAAYALGGAPLLVQTVEQLTGLTVDHYVEVGFGGVTNVVDAIGGVELCYDADVDDPESEMVWQRGCHSTDGHGALAFSRMRKADPMGDIGRAQRQREVIGAVGKKVAKPWTLLNPVSQVRLAKSGTSAIVVDQDANVFDVARLALAFRRATSPDGATGTPTIADMGYDAGDLGSAVLLDEDRAQADFAALREGKWNGG